MSKPRNELRQAILKEGLVKSELVRWEKNVGDPIKQTNQQIVEIPIDDLMAQVDTYVKEREESYAEIFKWLLGESGDFPTSEPGKRYNWRAELRARLKELQAKKGKANT